MYCETCKNLVCCVCNIDKTHKDNCLFRRAAVLSVELECEHGFQACPICDPCNCGIEVVGIK